MQQTLNFKNVLIIYIDVFTDLLFHLKLVVIQYYITVNEKRRIIKNTEIGPAVGVRMQRISDNQTYSKQNRKLLNRWENEEHWQCTEENNKQYT